MRYKLATACFVIGATLAPVAFAEDKDADRANPATFVKDSAITIARNTEGVKSVKANLKVQKSG